MLHALWFTIWVLLNAGLVPAIKPFDPFPYSFLTLVVSLEAIFLSTFVLISQNHQSRLADKRAHLDLQINMLAEQESTLMLDTLHQICDHFGLGDARRSRQVEELTKDTDVHKLVNALDETLPSK